MTMPPLKPSWQETEMPSDFSSQKDNSTVSKQSRVVNSGKTQIHLHTFKFPCQVTSHVLNQAEKRLGSPHQPSLQIPAGSVEIPQREKSITKEASSQHLQSNPSISYHAGQPDTNLNTAALTCYRGIRTAGQYWQIWPDILCSLSCKICFSVTRYWRLQVSHVPAEILKQPCSHFREIIETDTGKNITHRKK